MCRSFHVIFNALKPVKKILIIRLSSFGDVILARDAFSQVCRYAGSDSIQVDWLVKENFSIWLESVPGIRQVHKVPEKISLIAWIRLVKSLSEERYDVVIDLHRTLRTFVFRFVWRIFSPGSQVNKISKERIRLWGLFCLKKLWPRFLHPTPWFLRYERVVSKGIGSELENTTANLIDLSASAKAVLLKSERSFVVMPSSRWSGKEWPLEQYVQLIKETGIQPVVLGQSSDSASRGLVERLKQESIPYQSLVGASVIESVRQIQKSIAYIGADTGLAHLSESLGTPVLVILGPTHEHSGFPPRLTKSKTFGSSLWCRPCSKDGSACFRITNRYRCLTDPDDNNFIRTQIASEIKILLDKHDHGAKNQ